MKSQGHYVFKRAAVLVGSAGLAFGTVGVFGAAQVASAASSHSSLGAASVHFPAVKAKVKTPAHSFATHPAAAAALPAARPQVTAASIHETFVVDTNGDPVSGTSCAAGHAAGKCSLRAAVNVVDADTGHADAITIPAGRHVLLSQMSSLSVTNSMVINGTGASVNGDGGGIFLQFDNPVVQINGLKIAGGVATDGGAVDCDTGSLVLSHVDINGNSVSEFGGGVFTMDTCQLWVDDSVVSANRAGSEGGGLYLDGSADIVRTVIGGSTSAAGNVSPDGAGLYNDGGVVDVTDSTVSHNTTSASQGEGAGIYNCEVMDLVGGSIDHNSLTAGGDGAGLANESNLQMSGTTIAFNTVTGPGAAEGAGIYDDGDVTSLANVAVVDNNAKVTGGSSINGGSVYSDASQFTWTGGTISGSINGIAGANNTVTGGALELDGSGATVQNVAISGTANQALPNHGVSGGAVYTDADATLRNVTIANTTSHGDFVDGGAFYNDSDASLDGVSISTTVNGASSDGGDGVVDGGAVYNDSSMVAHNLSVTTTSDRADLGSLPTPSSTSSRINGGAFYNDSDLAVTGLSVTGTTAVAVGGNSHIAGGGMYNDSLASLTNAQVVGVTVQADDAVDGGILYNDDHFGATNFTLGNATVRLLGGPKATSLNGDGTLVYSDDQFNVVNATFANVSSVVPSAAAAAWEIANESDMQLTNTTISGNNTTGPSGHTWLLWSDSGPTSLLNTIVASSVPTRNCATAGAGTILSAGFNIDNGHSCKFTNSGDQQNTNPMVAALANNGGAVETAALMPVSPAIDKGTGVGCPPTDARGVARPAGGCDVGAYEFVPGQGYLLAATDGGVFPFGPAAHFYGSLGSMHLNAPIVGIATDPATGGYWMVASDGGVFPFHAPFFGSLGATPLNKPIVGIGAAPNGNGYWLVASDGGVFPFGSGAHFYGSLGAMPLNAPVVGMAADAATGGYWLVASDGGVFPFHAPFLGSTGGTPLNKPVVGMASVPAGTGYYLAASDGGVFPFGAPFFGSTGGMPLNKPVVGIAVDPVGGYWLVASDGGVFPFHAPFFGSTGGIHLNEPIVGMAAAAG